MPGTARRAGAVIAYAHLGHDGHRFAGRPSLVDALDKARKFDRILVEADGSARKPLKAPAAHEPVIPMATDTLIIIAGINGFGVASGRGKPVSRRYLVKIEWAHSGLSYHRRAARPQRGASRRARAWLSPHVRRTLFLNQANTSQRKAEAKRVAECLAVARGNRVETVVIGHLPHDPRLQRWCRLHLRRERSKLANVALIRSIASTEYDADACCCNQVDIPMRLSGFRQRVKWVRASVTA